MVIATDIQDGAPRGNIFSSLNTSKRMNESMVLGSVPGFHIPKSFLLSSRKMQECKQRINTIPVPDHNINTNRAYLNLKSKC